MWTTPYSQANPCTLMNWPHIPSKAHHHSPGPTARPSLACLWLTTFPMKGPPAGPYTPHSRIDPCVFKGNCISEEKSTSVDEALQPPACSWWSASPKRSTSVVQALNPCRPPHAYGPGYGPCLAAMQTIAYLHVGCTSKEKPTMPYSRANSCGHMGWLFLPKKDH